jgi:hypothetical protein
MKTSFPALRSSARQRAEAQFAGLPLRPARQHAKSQAMPIVGRAITLDAAGLADLNATVRRGLHGFIPRPEIATERE